VTTIVVAIIVGAFSGLLGSIAGPFLSHQLDRRRRSELRKEERRRELRQMLEAVMRLARAQQSGLTEYQISAALGRSLEEVRLRQIHYIQEIELKYPFFFWRPHRIMDEQLRRVAQELQDANTAATMLWPDLLNPAGRESPAQWDEEVSQLAKRIDAVLEAVDARLDELDW